MNSSTYTGIVSSFFIQPIIKRKTNKPMELFLIQNNSIEDDWAMIGNDVYRASQKTVKQLPTQKQNNLLATLSRYEPKSA